MFESGALYTIIAFPTGSEFSRMVARIETPAEIDKMREAGKYAASVLEMIGTHVEPGVTTEALNQVCHDYIVDELHCIPAPLNYGGGGGPDAVSQIHLHVRQPRGLPRHSERRQGAEERRRAQHRHHRDQGRLPWGHEQNVLRGRAERARQASRSRHAGVLVQRHRVGQSRRASRRHRLRHSEARRIQPLLRGSRVLRPRDRPRFFTTRRRCCTTANAAPA